MFKLTLVATTITFDAAARSITFGAGDITASLQLINGHVGPVCRLNDESPEGLSVRLTLAAMLPEASAWINDMTLANKEACVEAHAAFLQLSLDDPDNAALVAIGRGMTVLADALKNQQTVRSNNKAIEARFAAALEGIELMPTTIELTHVDGERAIKLVCGDASVVLFKVDTGSKTRTIGGTDEVGDPDSMQGRNLKATFAAMMEVTKKYLLDNGSSDEVIIMTHAGWEELKKQSPQVCLDMLPHLLTGQATLEAKPLSALSPDETTAFIEAETLGEGGDGEKTLQQLLATMSAKGPAN